MPGFRRSGKNPFPLDFCCLSLTLNLEWVAKCLVGFGCFSKAYATSVGFKFCSLTVLFQAKCLSLSLSDALVPQGDPPPSICIALSIIPWFSNKEEEEKY